MIKSVDVNLFSLGHPVCRRRVALLVVAVLCSGGIANGQDRLVPGKTSVDPVRQAAWKAANNQAKGKIDRFDAAMKSGNPERIRKATLELQADPLAVQHLNNSSRTDLIDFHNKETGAIKDATKQNIKQEMADKWNATHPNDKITAADVEIKEPTNYKSPDAKPKVGQDWDVTVTVKGKDVPTSMSKGVVEDSYFKAAGGEKTFGKGKTPQDVAHQQAVEVTDSKSLEAYKEPDKILGKDGQAPDHSSKLQNPEDLGQVIEYKSNQAGNKAAEARTKGNEVDAVRQDYEQMRQAVKQYDKITDPRVKAGGGKINNQVDKGMQIMRDVADMKISPEEGRAKLAEMGETPDSITRKAAGQIETAQKFQPTKQTPDAPDTTKTSAPDTGKTSAPDAGKTSAPDAGKTSAPDTAKTSAPDTAKTSAPDTAKTSAPDTAKTSAPDTAKTSAPDTGKTSAPDTGKTSAPDTPKTSAPDTGKTSAPDTPKTSAPDTTKTSAPDTAKTSAPDTAKTSAPDTAKTSAPDTAKTSAPDTAKTSAPDTAKTSAPDTAKTSAPDTAKTSAPDTGKTSAPDTAKTSAPDTAKTSTPDGGKVTAPDTPKVGSPDAPKTGKTVAPDVPSGKVGKAIKTVGTVGDAIDIFSNAKDFADAAKKGDTEGMKDAVVNTADSVTGGFYGTTQVVKGRAEDAGEYVEEVSAIDRTQMEAAKQQQMTVDLRNAGYTKDQADKMVESYTKGDESAVKDAYGKMNKDIPKTESAGPTSVSEAAGIYVEEVKENVKEVGEGIKTQAGKAKDFLVETGQNLGEIGAGVTEKGVASELATQVKENVSSSNLKDGYDTWQQNKESTSREAEAHKRLVEKLVAGGAKPSEAKSAVDDYYGTNNDEGRTDRTKLRDLVKKMQARKEKSARDAEPEAEGEDEDGDAGGEDENQGGLKSFASKRGTRTSANAESSYGLMGENQNVKQASTRGDQAEADAKAAIDSAGGDAQSTKSKTASSTAAADKEDSLGKAIADGVQKGVETGASQLGSSFGKAAAKQVADAAFGDPEKEKHGGGHAGHAGEGKPGVQAGGKKGPSTGGKKGGGASGKSGGATAKSGDGETKPDAKAPVAEPEKPKTRRGVFCKACNSEMTYKGKYYADGTDMYYCPGCNATMHHVGGPCPYEVRDVPVETAPPPATTPVTTPPPATPPSTDSSGRPTKGKSGGTLVYCKNSGCNNAKEVLMGDTTAPWECSTCFMKRYNGAKKKPVEGSNCPEAGCKGKLYYTGSDRVACSACGYARHNFSGNWD